MSILSEQKKYYAVGEEQKIRMRCKGHHLSLNQKLLHVFQFPGLRTREPGDNLSASAKAGLCQLQTEVYHQVLEPVDINHTSCEARAPPSVMKESMMDLRGDLAASHLVPCQSEEQSADQPYRVLSVC